MIRELRVREIGLVESADVRFQPGLNLLTGETGSGKSLIVDALGLALGDRIQPGLVRHGADRGSAEALFQVNGNERACAVLDAAGRDVDGLVTLGREVGRRSTATLAGTASSPAQLREVAEVLVAIHGQTVPGAHHPLRDEEQQRSLLDSFAGAARERESVAEAHRSWTAAVEELDSLRRLEARGRREEDYMRWQLAELRAANLREGEEDELRAERGLARHATRLHELTAAAVGAASGDEALALAADRLRAAAELDPRLLPVAERIEAVEMEVREAVGELRAYGESLDADPQRLEQLEARLAELERIRRKYGGSIASAIEERDRLERQLAQTEDLAGAIETAQDGVARGRDRLETAAAALTAVRQRAAVTMGERVTRELAHLKLEDARLTVELNPSEVGPAGAETVVMMFTANPGEPPLPVHRVASGGELARLMLAIRTVAAAADRIPTLIFDEVDAGIGGEAALRVGRRLKELARTSQVLVVTHLPQIACFADHHLVVHKQPAGDGRNVVAVRELKDEEERAQELARMMSGSVTEKALARAHELLEEASAA